MGGVSAVEVTEVVCRGWTSLISHRACPRSRRKSCHFWEAQSYEYFNRFKPRFAIYWAQRHTPNERVIKTIRRNGMAHERMAGVGGDPLFWFAFAIFPSFLPNCPASCRIESVRISFDHATHRILRCERTKKPEAVG